jgi:hypothetical protein
MKNMRMLWDIGPNDISIVMDTMVPIVYKRVQDYSVIVISMHRYFLALDSVQWIFGVFPPGRDPNRVLKQIIELRLPNISTWIGEPHESRQMSMIDLHLRYH